MTSSHPGMWRKQDARKYYFPRVLNYHQSDEIDLRDEDLLWNKIQVPKIWLLST